jgi:nucleotide-binding universal stress UspA family protein
MNVRVIALPVALQRYIDAPPVAVRQRDIAAALAQAGGARLVVFSGEAPLGLLPSAESVAEKLRAFVQPLRDQGLAVDAEVLHGKPGDVVPAAIAAAQAELAIIGSHSKRSVGEVALGSTAAALLRHVACPVLLVRPTKDDEQKARQMMIPHYPWVFTYV